MTKKQQIEVGGRELTVSNLDKIFFPETGFTKGEVIGFYTAVADVILPHLRDRPLTLKRYPEGVTGEPAEPTPHLAKGSRSGKRIGS